MKSMQRILFRKKTWIFPLSLFVVSLFYSCSNPEPFSTLLREIPFKHIIIDDQLHAGNDCCSDVVALGDLNGDGYLDIVIGTEYSTANGLFWYQYPDWTRHVIGSGDFTTDGETGDVDADGDTDIIISAISRDAIEWWENKGNPTRREGWSRHEIGSPYAHDLVIGDINNDGRLDVVTKGGSFNWFEAPADLSQSWIKHELDNPAGEGLDLGDIDGDGDLDIAVSHFWYENQNGDGSEWQQNNVTSSWEDRCRSIIADINKDGKPDIVLSHSEGEGRLSWFENPGWSEHAIEPDNLDGAHSLEVGDFNGDGHPDVFTGEMHTSSSKRVLLYKNWGYGTLWEKISLDSAGTHNARIGDMGRDGDLDIVGKNYAGTDRVLEMWENLSANTMGMKDWDYIPVDQNRPKSQMGKMGLLFDDVNGDGLPDIIAGSFVYLNPGGDLHAAWTRAELPDDMAKSDGGLPQDDGCF